MTLRVLVCEPAGPAHTFARERTRDLMHLAVDHPVELVRNERWVARVSDGPRPILARERWRVTRTARPRRDGPADLVFAYGPVPLGVRRDDRLVWHHTFRRPAGMDPADWRALEGRRHSHAARRARKVVVPHVDDMACFAELFPHARDKVEVLPYYLPGLEPIGDAELVARTAAPGPLRVARSLAELPSSHVLVLTRRDELMRVAALAYGVVVVDDPARVASLANDRGMLADEAAASLATFRREAWHPVVGERYVSLFRRVASA